MDFVFKILRPSMCDETYKSKNKTLLLVNFK